MPSGTSHRHRNGPLGGTPFLFGLAVAALLVLPAPARAQNDELSAVAQRLRSNPVYVDSQAELAGQVDAGELRQKIRDSGASPMFVAVLPDSIGGEDPNGALRSLRDEVGLRGTYALVVGNHFRAGSDLVPAGPQATIAAQEHPGEIEPALLDFIGRVGDLRQGRKPSDSTGSGAGASILAPLVLVAAVAGGGALILSRRRRRRREAEELAEVKENARDDLVALGDDIRALDLDVEMPNLDPAVREDYARAVAAYDRANRVFETARSARELAPAAEALEEGRWAMASAKARLEGREPPERRAPCFFDPRHGPSSREVEWAPPSGAPRPVPACEADAQRVERGEDPEAREILQGGRRVPYWEAGPAYAPFYGGFFGGGLLPGLLIGEALGGGWGDPGGDWGDPGGGDFGGGDIGGGDFGGGDFGGGDF